MNQLLQGRNNQDNLSKQLKEKPVRLPVTITLLKLLRLEIKKLNLPDLDKKLFWLVATLAFSGGFRPGELLCTHDWKYDSTVTLLARDVQLQQVRVGQEEVLVLQCKLKSEKQRRKAGHTLVDVYQSSSKLCPIQAYQAWTSSRPPAPPSGPAFCRSTGAALTKSVFNKWLKLALQKHTEGLNGYISGHSFRIGLASLLGSMGHNDADIMQAGRWSSSAFLAYLKLPRTRRLTIAKQIANACS